MVFRSLRKNSVIVYKLRKMYGNIVLYSQISTCLNLTILVVV